MDYYFEDVHVGEVSLTPTSSPFEYNKVIKNFKINYSLKGENKCIITES
ncbi:hypothetical protein NNC19_17270 [Clostridium sp. SHJSY1]|nr:hypothetical protein [Clostridium sp. SHJSY1]MDS0527443.1 hypothetical protein [Clostridium sp. SHJSY1]